MKISVDMWKKNIPFYTRLLRIFEYCVQFGTVRCNAVYNIVQSVDGNMIKMQEEKVGEKRKYQKDKISLNYKTDSKWHIQQLLW